MSAESTNAACFLQRTIVIIPALNEAECVARTVSFWRELGVAGVRVVDNGSTDATAALAAAAGAEVRHEARRGYGAACWTGLLDWPAGVDWILFSSADGSDRLAALELAQWQREVEAGAVLIMGDRFSAPASRRQLKAVQRFGNRLCCTLIFLGWGGRFRDMGSLRLLRRTAFEAMALKDRGFGWNIEMQVRALELGLRWRELPVAYHPRLAGTSKISGSLRGTIKAAWGMMRMILELRLRRSS